MTRESQNEIETKDKIESRFGPVSDQMFDPYKGGFNLNYGQPAQQICKNISECKSVFDH